MIKSHCIFGNLFKCDFYFVTYYSVPSGICLYIITVSRLGRKVFGVDIVIEVYREDSYRIVTHSRYQAQRDEQHMSQGA